MAKDIVIFMYKYARLLKFYEVPVIQKAASIEFLQSYLDDLNDKDHNSPGLSDVILSIYTMLSSLHTELGKHHNPHVYF